MEYMFMAQNHIVSRKRLPIPEVLHEPPAIDNEMYD